MLTQSQPLSQGYGYAAPELLDWLAAHATPVFTATGPTTGAPSSGGSTRPRSPPPSPRGETLPPVTGGYP